MGRKPPYENTNIVMNDIYTHRHTHRRPYRFNYRSEMVSFDCFTYVKDSNKALEKKTYLKQKKRERQQLKYV